MAQYRLWGWGVILLWAMVLGACTKTPQERYDKILQQYRTGEVKEDPQPLAQGLLEYAALGQTKNKDIVTGDEVLFKNDEDTLAILWPEEEYNLSMVRQITEVAMDETNTVATDGKEFFLYTRKGELLKRGGPKESEETIEAMVLYREGIFYYRGGRVYRHDLTADRSRPFTGESFKSPYKEYFQKRLLRKNSIGALVLGIAGSYYISLFDLAAEEMRIKNLKAASSHIALGDEGIYYVTGKTGGWEVMFLQYDNKEKTKIRSFKDILNLELFSEALVTETKKGVFIMPYRGEAVKIPFNFTIKGKSGENMIIESEGELYLASVPLFFEGLLLAERAAPHLFKE